MGALHRPHPPRRSLRRGAAAVAITLATVTAGLALGNAPANAAGPWYVAPAPTGVNDAACGLSAATPCATVTFVLAKAAFASGDTINVAPGVYTDRPVITSKGATITGAGPGVVFDGGGVSWAIAVNGTAPTLNLDNLTLRNGAFSGGGALPIVTSTVNANGVSIVNSTSSLGGGVAVYNGATFNMTGGDLTGNTATAAGSLAGGGGALYVIGRAGATPAGTATLSGVTVSGNRALGAAQPAAGNGGAIFNAGNLTVTGSTFTGNQAVASTNTSNPRRGFGGAIHNGAQDADDAPIALISSTTINGGTVAGGFNATYGGALSNGEAFGGPAPVLSAGGVVLDGNVANLGGAIYNAATLTFTGGEVKGSTAYSGGGVYNAPAAVPATPGVVATFDGTAFTANTANSLTVANYGNGGAIFNTESLVLQGGTSFTGNRAIAATVSSLASGWGGAVWNGAFAANDAPVLTISDTTIAGGSAAGGNAFVGGAIASPGNVYGFAGGQPGKVTATGLTVTGNVAAVAGGVYVAGTSSFTGGALTGNQATNASGGYGGGLYTSRLPVTDPAPVITLDGTDLTGNTSALAGGGAAVGSGATLRIGGADVSGNVAVLGGGLYNTGTVEVAGSQVAQNSASFQGGGIYNGSNVATDTPTLTLTDVDLTDNSSAVGGGGLLHLKGGSATVTGGEISRNLSTGAAGVLVGDSAVASFDGTDFRDNTATAGNGGALVNSGTTTVRNAEITGNEAVHTNTTPPNNNTGLAGAVYSGSNTAGATTKLTIVGSTIADNDAWAGSALVTFSPAASATNLTSVDRSTISGNRSTTNIGAIEQFHPLSITNSTITGNTAVGGPGAFAMIDPARVSVAGSIVAGNGATSCTAAFVDGGYNLTSPGDASCGAGTNRTVGDPQLGPLADNGGSTQTHLPGPSSPALDRIPAATASPIVDAVSGTPVTLCPPGAVDQRGSTRPAGARCDVGAVEAAQEAPTVDGPAAVTFAKGISGTTFDYTSTGSPTPQLSIAGTLPAGLTLTDHGDGTATLGGTPTGAGGTTTVQVVATNEAGSDSVEVTITVNEAPEITGPAAATYTVGVAGGPSTFTASTGFPASALATSSTLPAGVTFQDHGDGTATIAGTPADGTGGVYVITITADNGTPPDATHVFTLTVNEAPTLTGPATAGFTVGSNGASAVFTSDGYPAATLMAADLPAGLTFDDHGDGTGRIVGNPADGTGGEYDVVVTAANGTAPDASVTVHLVVTEAPEITGPTSARFVAGFNGTIGFTTDSYPQATLTAAGDIPPGITFTDHGDGTGSLHGTAPVSAVGDHTILIHASNSAGSATLEITLTVVPPLSITTTALPAASVGTSYGSQIQATGGQPAYSFSVVGGALPAGLTLNSDGTVTGVPTGPTGTSSFTVKVLDSALPSQSFTKVLTITVGKGSTTLTPRPLVLDISGGLTELNLQHTGWLTARLTGGSPAIPIGGQTLVFKVGNTTVCTSVTAANGSTTCVMNLVNTALALVNGSVTVSYAGNALWNPSTTTAPLITF